MKTHPLNNTVILHDGTNGAEIIAFWKSQGVDTGDLVGRISGRYYGLADGTFDVWPEPMVKDLKVISLPPKPTLTKEQVLRWDGLPELLYEFVKKFHVNGPLESAIDPIKDFISAQLEPEAVEEARKVVLKCQDGDCYDSGQTVFYATPETGEIFGDPAGPCSRHLCFGPYFLSEEACQSYLDSLLIGYQCPMDLFGGKVKKGDLYVKTLDPSIYLPSELPLRYFELPSEIVTSWTPIYRKPSADQ